MPQAFANDPDFGWLWGYGMDVPANWENPGPVYLADVSTAWPNCTYAYTTSYDIVNSPGAQEYKDPGTTYTPGYKTVAQTYNGLLQSLPTAGIVSPTTCPLIWEAYGNTATILITPGPTDVTRSFSARTGTAHNHGFESLVLKDDGLKAWF